MTNRGVDESDISLREKIKALYIVGTYRPLFTTGIIGLSIFAALLEGIGMSFLIPVIEIAQGSAETGTMSTVGATFVRVYGFLQVPFTLEFVILGVVSVMSLRYLSSFVVAWLRAALRADYIRHLQSDAFDSALHVHVSFYDRHGSDEILNAIVTQVEYAGKLINQIVRIVEQCALSLMYLAVAIYLAPWLTIVSGGILGGFLYALRYKLESGYDVGDRVAEANERVQMSVQAGTQGIRDVKLFGLAAAVYNDFQRAVDQFVGSLVKLHRNRAIIKNSYELATAVTVFVIIYLALQYINLTLATLGVFLFAMFRLAPRVSSLSDLLYQSGGNLPHLIRTHDLVQNLDAKREIEAGEETLPDSVQCIAFENVEFSYEDQLVLDGLSFSIDQGEFVAFVGQSGAGKSTIVSLLARLYDPDRGQITANGTPLEKFDLDAWRSRLAVVRQHPHIFNDTLRYNVTIGQHDATEEEILEACEIAEVTEFLEELPQGLDTELGDDGVRLSGGQRQRVAIARALLKDADFLILDEGTSDLDTALEQKVHDGIEETIDCGMIVIAHRLSTVTDADRIFVMEAAKIVETGPPDELMELGGKYAQLYSNRS